MKRLKDVMTCDVEMVFPHTTIQEAAEKMNKIDVGMLPVCDGNRLSGIVTDRDIVVRAVSQNCIPKQTLVSDVMTHNVVYSYEDESVRNAATLMQENKIRRLIVLDRHKKLCGIVSLGDLAVETNQRLAGSTLRSVSESPVHLHQKHSEGMLHRLTRRPLTAISALLGTAAVVGAIRTLTKRSHETTEPLTESEGVQQMHPPMFEQESHESGIVSPIKNEIVEEHARLHSAGDPAVRRINPSREEAGVKTIRRPLFGKSGSQTGR